MIEVTFAEFNQIVFEVYRNGAKASEAYKCAGNKAVENFAVSRNALSGVHMRCAEIDIFKNESGDITGKMTSKAKGKNQNMNHDYRAQANLPWRPVKDSDQVREDMVYRLYSPQNSRSITGICLKFKNDIVKNGRSIVKRGAEDLRVEITQNDIQNLFFEMFRKNALAGQDETIDDFPVDDILNEMEQHILLENLRVKDTWKVIARENILRKWRHQLPGDSNEQNDAAPVALTSDTTELETERDALIKSRKGQGRFRAHVVKLWKVCSVTGVAQMSLLKASHIKPWIHSSDAEKLDPYNGLLLIPNLDSLFDEGLISFHDDGSMMISGRLSKTDIEKLGLHFELRLRRIYDATKKYLHYHREQIFKQ